MTRHSVLSNPLRRHFLGRGTALAAMALGATGLAPLLQRRAFGADYKALVCLFMYGGNDGMNMVVPTDGPRHDQYAGVRGTLALAKESLLALAGSSYGLHPAMAALQPLWAEQKLATVFNVGPLIRPLTKDDYLTLPAGSPEIPENLFSHSDQQLRWQSASSESPVRTGWGGRASATLATLNPVISVGGNGHFGLEALRSPLVLPGPGAAFGALGLQSGDMSQAPNALRKAAVDALYAQAQPLLLGETYSVQQRIAFQMSERLSAIVASMPGDALALPAIDAAFAPLMVDGAVSTALGQQLYQVAKLIAYNTVVQGDRQVFFAQQGGYDTHADQLAQHALLLGELADALAAFQRAMEGLGMAEAVTLFTQSDFGRTFVPNATSGTDHAWGNHQLVLGGSVKGGRAYGSYPTLVPGGPDDVGLIDGELQGRWIPTSSVDQYAATLLDWFGADAEQLDLTLPNLVNFGSGRSLGFV